MPKTITDNLATVPQSLDAEQQILGAMLKDNDAVNTAVEILTPTDFYYPKHQIIFENMVSLYTESQPIDITTITNRLNTQLNKIGGRLYLVELCEIVISTTNIQAHCEIVKEKSLIRKLSVIGENIVGGCKQGKRPIGDLLNEAETGIYNISDRHLGYGLSPISADMPDLLQYISDRAEGLHEENRVKTGFYDLDDILNLENGELIIVAADTSIGKSAFALNIMEYVALNLGKPVSLNAIEMTRRQLEIRMLSQVSGVNHYLLTHKNKQLQEQNLWNKLTAANAKLFACKNIFIDDSTDLTPNILRSKLRKLKSKYGLALGIVDYLQLMRSGKDTSNSVEEITSISRQLLSVAKDLDIPLIVLSQLSRLPAGIAPKRPSLSRLRGSGSIEQDANTVLFIYRKTLDATDAEIIVAKQRSGGTGTVDLYFDKEITKFKNRTKKEMPF